MSDNLKARRAAINECESAGCIQASDLLRRDDYALDAKDAEIAHLDTALYHARGVARYERRRAEAAEAERDRLRYLVQTLLDEDPNDLAADGGVTVLDVWRRDAEHELATNQPAPESERADAYLIRTDKGLWRPNAAGYTSNPAEAGRYTYEEATRHTRGLGPEKRVQIMHVSEITPEIRPACCQAARAVGRPRRTAEVGESGPTTVKTRRRAWECHQS